MRFCDVFNSYIDSKIMADAEVKQALSELEQKIPGRVFQMEFDDKHSNKQGVKHNDSVFKLGLDLSTSTAFIEYFENYNQGQPTIAVYAEKNIPALVFKGRKVNDVFEIGYRLHNGAVTKTVSR